MTKKIHGGCLCGEVRYSVVADFKAFYQCHCKQCQQQSGSAFAANLFTKPENVAWVSGQDSVVGYAHETRSFANAFCKICGCSVPYLTKSEKAMIIPAGSLTESPEMAPQANIFCTEEIDWLQDGRKAKSFSGFPE